MPGYAYLRKIVAGARRPLVLLDPDFRVVVMNDAARPLVRALQVPADLGLTRDVLGPREVEAVRDGRRVVLRGTLVPVDNVWLLEVDDVSALHEQQALAARLARHLRALTELSRATELLEDGFTGFARRACDVLAFALEIEQVDVWLLDVDSEIFSEQGHELRHAASSRGPGSERLVQAPRPLLDALQAHSQVDGRWFPDSQLISSELGDSLITGVFSMGTLAGVAVFQSRAHRTWGTEDSSLAASFAETLSLGFETCRRRVAEANVQLRANQLEAARVEAEVADRAKSDFLATMSHEIRTPMNGVIGFTNLLLDGVLEGEQRDFANTIKASAESLLVIINDILDFSKIEAGKLALEVLPFDLETALSQSIELCLPRAEAKGLCVTLEYPHHLPHALTGDAGRVRQVVLNLLGNAIKFTAEGGVVVRVREHEGWLRVEVNDSGIGMSAETCQRLFQRFMQADSSVTRKYGGTGLGLAISRRLVELMQGVIGAESTPGHGSTFWFTLPMVDEVRPPAPVVEVPVTLVEPRAAVRTMWETIFGPQLRAVATGTELLALDGPLGVVVLDTEQASTPELLARLPPAHAAVVLRVPTGGRTTLPADAFLSRSAVKPSVLREALSRALQQREGFAPLVSADQPSPTARVRVSEGQRVLLVEDNLINQRLAERLLTREGCIVTLANNGLEAIAQWEQATFDLVLMDCNMPELDGLEATRRIRVRERERRSRTPIIALTADAMESVRQSCLHSGMDDYLSKPIREERLREVLSTHFAQRTSGTRPSSIEQNPALAAAK